MLDNCVITSCSHCLISCRHTCKVYTKYVLKLFYMYMAHREYITKHFFSGWVHNVFACVVLRPEVHVNAMLLCKKKENIYSHVVTCVQILYALPVTMQRKQNTVNPASNAFVCMPTHNAKPLSPLLKFQVLQCHMSQFIECTLGIIHLSNVCARTI